MGFLQHISNLILCGKNRQLYYYVLTLQRLQEGWAVSLDVILSKGSRQSEPWSWTHCIAQTSIRVPIPSSAEFRGAEIAAAFYNQQSLRPSCLLSHPVYLLCPSPPCSGKKHRALWLHLGPITRVWQVVPGWRAGGCPPHCAAVRGGTVTSALVTARDLSLQTEESETLYYPTFTRKTPGKSSMHVNLHGRVRCSTVNCACIKARSLDLHQLRKFRKACCS